MFVWRTFIKVKNEYGVVKSRKAYKFLLLFGFIPLFISIDG